MWIHIYIYIFINAYIRLLGIEKTCSDLFASGDFTVAVTTSEVLLRYEAPSDPSATWPSSVFNVNEA